MRFFQIKLKTRVIIWKKHSGLFGQPSATKAVFLGENSYARTGGLSSYKQITSLAFKKN